jgi:hypothetical protein
VRRSEAIGDGVSRECRVAAPLSTSALYVGDGIGSVLRVCFVGGIVDGSVSVRNSMPFCLEDLLQG